MADTKQLQSPDALKARFKAGSIPLQSDFADLIDLANAGAVAAGQAAGQINNAGIGMKYGTTGKLELNVLGSYNFGTDNDLSSAMPLSVDSSNNRPVVDLAYGLTGGSDGLSVKASTGIVVNSNGVSVASDTMAYVEAAARGVGKFHGQDGKAGVGMRYSADGKLEPNLESHDYDGSEAGVLPLKIDSSTNMMVVDLDLGLAASDDGLSVKPSTGIKVDTNGVSVDMGYVVPKGIIVMFSGSAAPTGWAFCDGSNGTPDLRDRFIRGSKSFTKSTGGQTSITYTPSGSVTVNSHTLTVSEMPSHRHNIVSGVHYGDQGGEGRWTTILGLSYTYNYNPGSVDTLALVGGNAGHSHGASFKGDSYTIKLEPQYYALAFIMKL